MNNGTVCIKNIRAKNGYILRSVNSLKKMLNESVQNGTLKQDVKLGRTTVAKSSKSYLIKVIFK